jgi:hypothetical protein
MAQVTRGGFRGHPYPYLQPPVPATTRTRNHPYPQPPVPATTRTRNHLYPQLRVTTCDQPVPIETGAGSLWVRVVVASCGGHGMWWLHHVGVVVTALVVVACGRMVMVMWWCSCSVRWWWWQSRRVEVVVVAWWLLRVYEPGTQVVWALGESTAHENERNRSFSTAVGRGHIVNR